MPMYAVPIAPTVVSVYTQPAQQQPAAPAYAPVEHNEILPPAPPADDDDGAEEEPFAQRAHSRPVKGFARLLCVTVLGFCAVWMALICLLVGPVSVFGETFSIVKAFEFCVDLFSIHRGVIYETLAKVALVIAYVVILVYLIKDAVWITKTIVTVLFRGSNGKTEKQNLSSASFIAHDSSSGFVKLYCLMLLTFAATGAGLTELSWALIGVGLCYSLITACILAWPKGEQAETGKISYGRDAWENYVFDILRQILILLLLLGLAFTVAMPSAYDISFGVQVLFSGGFQGIVDFLKQFFDLLVQDVLDIVVIIMFMVMLVSAMGGHGTMSAQEKWVDTVLIRYCVRILIVTCIGAVLTCFFASLTSSGSFYYGENTLSMWWTLLRDHYVPVIFLSVMGILIGNFMPSSSKTK